MTTSVWFLTSHPVEAAGTRYRVTQYFPWLQAEGFQCQITPFLSADTFRELYQPGKNVSKVASLLKAMTGRLTDALLVSRHDVVVVAREAMLFGPPLIEWIISQFSRRPLIFDFDDAVFVPYSSPTYGRLATFLKYPAKTSGILKLSDHILAGNEYLADYARQHNQSVTILPTVVDTRQYQLAADRYRSNADQRRFPVVGWIGSHSTAQYLDLVKPALSELGQRYDFTLRIIGAGRDISIPGVRVENVPWRLETELQDFASLDIGLYPIRNDEWAQGKCAFKAIQYLAAGVPCVCSPVGMTTEVIQNGVNGLLAESPEQWVKAIEQLLTDQTLRRSLIEQGRQTVSERYSLQVHAPRLAKVLREVAR